MDLIIFRLGSCDEICTSRPQAFEKMCCASISRALFFDKFGWSTQTRLTIAEGHESPEKTNGDVLLFPEMVKYK